MISPEDAQQIIRVFCASTTTLSLATIDEHHHPYAANVNYAADEELHLYFISHPESTHAKHIHRDPIVAATSYAAFQQPEDIRGIQVHGTCQCIADAEFESVWRIFQTKFPFIERFEKRIRDEQFYRIELSWVKYIDNAIRFGYKWQSAWPPTMDIED